MKALYMDTKILESKREVQRNVNFNDLLLNHTVCGEICDMELMHRGYMPVNMCYSVRTVYSNLVLERDLKNKKLYYFNVPQVSGELMHKGEDLVMFIGSQVLLNSIKLLDGFDELMLKYSAFQPIGLYYDSFLNPIFYSHIIMRDESIESLNSFLKEGNYLKPITKIESKGNIKALLDTLILVKERGSEDEK